MAKSLIIRRGYRGKLTAEVYYPPGAYEKDSPVFEHGQYLVDNGHAYWAGQEPELAPAPVDRDMSGKPISIPLPQNTAVIDPILPIGLTFPNNVDASQVIQPFETGGAFPSVIMGAEDKTQGSLSVQTNLEAAVEKLVTESLAKRMRVERNTAAANLEDENPPADAAGVVPDEESTETDFDGLSDDELKVTAAGAGIKVRTNESRESLIEKLKAKTKPVE